MFELESRLQSAYMSEKAATKAAYRQTALVAFREIRDALDTHRSLLNGELDLADAAEMRTNTVVKLCKALGGGWQQPERKPH